MSPKDLTEALNRELSAADPMLVGNDDLLRGVLAGCGDCIKILDLDGRLQFMSEGGRRVMEVDDFSPLKGCPWPEFWAGAGNMEAITAVAAAKRGETARFRGEANTAKGNPRYWDVQVSPIRGPDGAVAQLLSISRDITEEWRLSDLHQKGIERQSLLSAELQHRVKNTLATVIAIANQTFSGSDHLGARHAFTARLQTLGNAYDILTETHFGKMPIARVIEGALAPHQSGEGRIRASGPDIDIESKQALSLALAANELATNALKYGALAVPTGRVEVVWSIDTVDGAPVFRFVWREAGGPEVVKPTRFGFGSRVIKTLLQEDFGGAVEVDYEPTGLVCRLTTSAARLPG